MARPRRRAVAARRRAASACGRAARRCRAYRRPAERAGRSPACGSFRSWSAKRQVLAHRHVRVKRVVLKHHGDVAVLGRHVVHDPVADADSRRDRLESGDHAQRRALSTARRADEHDELAVGDIEIDAVNRDVAAVLIYFAHAFRRTLAIDRRKWLAQLATRIPHIAAVHNASAFPIRFSGAPRPRRTRSRARRSRTARSPATGTASPTRRA